MGRNIVTNLITNDKASGPLKDAGAAASKTARNYDDLSAAEQRLALAAEKAGTAVEKAAKAAANAEQRFGKESEQARAATLRLRSAKLDLADAEEKVAAKARAAGDAADDATKQVHQLADAADSANDSVDRSGNALGRLGGILGKIAPALGLGVARMSAFGTVALTAGPPVIGLGLHMAALGVKVAQFGGAVAPAAASLLPLAAGLALIKGTLIATGPAFTSALSPLTKAFADVEKPVGRLATRGVPGLAREFVRVNFPAIRSGMEDIATSVNHVVVQVGKWINSTTGQRAIAASVENITGAFRELAPDVGKLAIAFLNLFGRTAGDTRAVDLLATALNRAIVGATNFINGLTTAKIDAAWTAIGRFAGSVRDFAGRVVGWGAAIMGAVRWWRAHADAIQHVRDILGIVAVAVGVATGGWIPALVAGISLLVAHWDQVSGALDRVNRWFHGTSDEAGAVRGVVAGLQGVVADLWSWFAGKLLPALERAGRAILPTLRDAVGSVSRTLHDNKDAVAKVQAILSVLGLVLTEVVIPALTWVFQHVLPVVVSQFNALVTVINRVVLPGIRIFTRLVLDNFGAVINGAAAMFGWVPGIGPKLRSAAAQFNKFRDQVNGALSGIKDQKVSVTATIGYTTGKGSASGGLKVGYKARGGLVTGPGGPRDDSIPTMLSNKEFVVNARDTAQHRPLLEAINSGQVKGYARGGIVMSTSTSGIPQMMAAERKALLAAAKRFAPDAFAGLAGGGSTAGARALGKVMAAGFGWSGGQWNALERLWTGESGWNPRAKNPTSTAFGIPQFLKSTAGAYGLAYGDTNPAHQIAAGLRYIRDVYGSPGNAYGQWSRRSPHWYGRGGVINEPVMGVGLRSGDRYGFGERGPETVIPGRPATAAFSRAAGGTTVVHEAHYHFDRYVGNRDELIRELKAAHDRGALRQIGIAT
jgi:hypothetical protein